MDRKAIKVSPEPLAQLAPRAPPEPPVRKAHKAIKVSPEPLVQSVPMVQQEQPAPRVQRDRKVIKVSPV